MKITPQMRGKIIEEREKGASTAAIAEIVGVSRTSVETVLVDAGVHKRGTRRSKNQKQCPKCKRGPFPREYTYCPFCTADMRNEKDRVLDLLKRAKTVVTPPLYRADRTDPVRGRQGDHVLGGHERCVISAT